MRKVFGRTESLRDTPFRYCPGCGHSIIHRLIAEAVDKLGIRERTIGVSPVGCAVFSHEYFKFDMIEVAHGRAPAALSAMKRLMPDRVLFSYQGDGDLAAIGTAEIVHAANRGENISVFFVNNAVYGMTGGQMAPTTLQGQRTTTTMKGRKCETSGHSLRAAEMLATLDGVSLAVRGAVDSYSNIVKARHYIEQAFRNQLDGNGFSFVELLSPCPTDWGMTPLESTEWLQTVMAAFYPLGVIKEEVCLPVG